MTPAIRSVIVVVSAFFCASAFQSLAGQDQRWLKAGANGEGDVYVASGTIVRTGADVKAWLLYNYRSARTDTWIREPYQSMRLVAYFKCRERQMGALQHKYFAAPWAQGAPVQLVGVPIHTATPTYFDVEPGSLNELAVETLCVRSGAK